MQTFPARLQATAISMHRYHEQQYSWRLW